MRDKLYSRRRIRLPNLKNINSVKIVLLILLVSILLSCIMFLWSAYPVFKTSCETAASSKGNKIVNDEVNKVMKNYSYNDLISIEKDVSGKISLIKANSVYINQIVSTITSNIQREFDKIPRIEVFINMGSVSGISVLNKIEPQFNLELESAGNIDATVRTEFTSVGINQTHHKIYLDIDTTIGILTPFDTFRKNVDTEVLLTEAIIVGEVPESYYNLEGISSPDDTYNFIN